MHLRQSEFASSPCGLFARHFEGIRKFEETSNLMHICNSKFDESCFAYNAAYCNRKDLAQRARILNDRAYEMAINPKYDEYQKGWLSMNYKFFNKKTGSGEKESVKEQLAQELYKLVVKKFKRRKDYAIFKDNTTAADIASLC